MSNRLRWRTAGVCLVFLAVSWGFEFRLRAQGTPQFDDPVGPVGSDVQVPTHQFLRPDGFQVTFPGRPTDLAFLDSGRIIAIKNRADIVFIETSTRVIRHTMKIPQQGLSFHGIIALENNRLLVTGSHDKLWFVKWNQSYGEADGFIQLPGFDGGPSSPGGIAIRNDLAYVTLSRNNTLGVVDLEKRTLEAEIPVGVAPYDVVLDQEFAYVSNWGGRHPEEGDPSDLSSGTPTRVDPLTNVASSGSLSILSLENSRVIKEIEVGLHPTDLALDPKNHRLYVANANSDTITKLSTQSHQILETLSTHPAPDLPFGSSPNALCLNADGTRLYVANGTNNAVVAFELGEQKSTLIGALPVGWYPGGLARHPKRPWLVVVNTKGIGSRHPPTDRVGYNTHNHLGSITLLTDLSQSAIQKGHEVVKTTNRFERLSSALKSPRANIAPKPIPDRHGEPSCFEHVVYIIKENRTYDQVLGDDPRGNGAPELCVFGEQVTPNHHALAREFVLLDNFYCSGILSADGHQWTNEAFVTDYIEKFFGGFTRSYPYEGDDPMAFAPTGFLWDNVLRQGKTFRCYGEMVQASIQPRGSFQEIYDDFIHQTGKVKIRATSHIDAVSKNMCETYIGFPSIVPDVYRAQEFIKELNRFEESGRLPHLMMLLLPNDHTAGTRPGMPTPKAAVADNDLALGQIVEAVSQSRFWPKTCIFVVQDDPQAGWDHVDSHRTVAFAISPYTKRGEVISTRMTQPGMVKSIELILGLPPMNQMDLLAQSMADCFQDEPDLTPYRCRPNRIPLDQLNASLDDLDGQALLDAVASLELNLDEIDQADEGTFNRILWRATKGDDTSYPEEQSGR